MSNLDAAASSAQLESNNELQSVPSATPTATGWYAAQLKRIFFTHNPFYVASACMVFTGLRASFSSDAGTIDVWALTLSLMAYTLLLSVTAFLVIRFGKVWDDARSLLLLIVLMFLGISVTFDGILAASPEQAARYYLLGWLFSATISELLLRSLRLRLGILFRAPFHLLLGLFFFYPLVLAPRLGNPDDPILAWQLFGFASVAALIFLSLLPAVRRGPAYLANNGSPWSWPWFPWVLFGVLGFCVSLRAYYLCVSLHFVGSSNSIFAPYFLVPLGLAAVVLLLEAGLVSRSESVVRTALFLPVLLLWMAGVSSDSNPVSQNFANMFADTIGASPLEVTLWLVTGFYLLAAVRRVVEASYPLIISLILLSVGRWLFDPSDGRGPDPLPLMLAGLWQVAMGWRLRRSGDVVVGSCVLLLSAVVAGQGTWFDGAHGILPVHILLGILLAAGYWYRDQTGYYSRRAGIALALLTSSWAALGDSPMLNDFPRWAVTLYPLAMGAILAGYGLITRDIWAYVATAVIVAACSFEFLSRMYSYLQHRVTGFNELALGALFFLLAALISLFKAGLYPSWLRRRIP